jgi:hypothetical protein
MKLTPAEYDQYYESVGIKASDLLSPQPLVLAELPADATSPPPNGRASRECSGSGTGWTRG